MKEQLRIVIELAGKVMHYMDLLEDGLEDGYIYYDDTVSDALDIIYDASLEIKDIAEDISKHVKGWRRGKKPSNHFYSYSIFLFFRT